MHTAQEPEDRPLVSVPEAAVLAVDRPRNRAERRHPTALNPLVGFREAALLTGVSESTLRRLDRAGALPGVVVHIPGARAYIRRAALLRWLDSEQAYEQQALHVLKVSAQ